MNNRKKAEDYTAAARDRLRMALAMLEQKKDKGNFSKRPSWKKSWRHLKQYIWLCSSELSRDTKSTVQSFRKTRNAIRKSWRNSDPDFDPAAYFDKELVFRLFGAAKTLGFEPGFVEIAYSNVYDLSPLHSGEFTEAYEPPISAILRSNLLGLFIRRISQALTWTMPHQYHPRYDRVLYFRFPEPTEIEERLSEKIPNGQASVMSYWVTVMHSFAKQNDDDLVPFVKNNPEDYIISRDLTISMEEFATAHEYAHHLLRHHLEQNITSERSFSMEHEADLLGCQLASEMKTSDENTRSRFSYGKYYGFSAVILLYSLDALMEYKNMLGISKKIRSNTHPDFLVRISKIKKHSLSHIYKYSPELYLNSSHNFYKIKRFFNKLKENF